MKNIDQYHLKCFNFFDRYFVLDVQSSNFFECDRKLFLYLNYNSNEKLSSSTSNCYKAISSSDDDIQKTIEYYLKKGSITKKLTAITRKIPSFVTNKESFYNHLYNNYSPSLFFAFSDNCNFACSYCYRNMAVRHASNKIQHKSDMNLQNVKSIIDKHVHRFPGKELSIFFAGGEPLLHLDDIKKVIRYVDNKYSDKDIKYGLTSNGSLITEDIMSFIVEQQNILLCISLDGPKRWHDTHRKFSNGLGSYDDVILIIDSFYEKYPDYMENYVVFLCVYESVENLKDCIEYFIERSWLHTIFSPMIENLRAPSLMVTQEGQNYIRDIINLYINAYEENNPELMGFYAQFFMSYCYNFIARYTYKDKGLRYSHVSEHCIPLSSSFIVDYNSEYCFCETIRGFYSCGSNNGDIDFKQIRRLYVTLIDFINNHCTKCWCRNQCSICWYHLIDMNGNISVEKLKNEKCKNMPEILEFTIEICIAMISYNPKIFERIGEIMMNYKDKTVFDFMN